MVPVFDLIAESSKTKTNSGQYNTGVKSSVQSLLGDTSVRARPRVSCRLRGMCSGASVWL